MPLHPRLLEFLCCPACREALAPKPDPEGLECVGCHRFYPVVDGVPNFLPEDVGLSR